MYKKLIIALMCLVLTSLQQAFATIEEQKLWLAFSTHHSIAPQSRWSYSFFTQMRFTKLTHPWQQEIIEGALNYTLDKHNTVGAGYRWSAHHPIYRNFFQENRLFQQWNSHWQANDRKHWFARSRFEELFFSNNRQNFYRLRQKITFEYNSLWQGKINPLIYEEVFLPLNKTYATAHRAISQNRLFIGVNYYVSKTNYWEIGYLNQLQIKTPQVPENQLSHILTITYNAV